MAPQEDDSHDFWRALQRREARAWAELQALIHRALRSGLAGRLAASCGRAELDDLAHDATVLVIRALDSSAKPPRNAYGFVRSQCLTVASAWVRHRDRSGPTVDPRDLDSRSTAGGGSAVEDGELRRALLTCRQSLTPEMQQAVRMRIDLGWSHRRIAGELFGVDSDTSRKRAGRLLHSAYAKLRSCLEDKEVL